MLPQPTLKWYAYYQASDPDVNPAVWVYDYYLGEKIPARWAKPGMAAVDFYLDKYPCRRKQQARFEISSLHFSANG